LSFWIGIDFNSGGDVVRSAEVEHLLCLGQTADRRAGQAAVPEQQTEGRNRERLFGRADEGQVPVTP
jgi:hypothetical protein